MGYRLFLDRNNCYLTDGVYDFYVRYDEQSKVATSVYTEYYEALKSSSVRPIFKFYSLYPDETIREDLTQYLITEGELSINYENGVRRKLSVSLFNEKDNWKITPISGFLWKGSKFKLYIGVQTSQHEYLFPAGVFILSDISSPHQYKKNIWSLELVDKFGGLDGSVGGSLIDGLYIPRGSNIYAMILQLLAAERIAGIPYDDKFIRFPNSLNQISTPYTINKSTNTDDTVGDIIKDLSVILNSDVYYDEYGHMNFEESSENILVNEKPTVWRFSNDNVNFISPSFNTSFQEVYNIVKVEGGNINGAVMDYTASNTNPKSPTNITVFEPKPYKLTDENIASVELAQKRAEYELYKKSLIPLSVSFTTPLIPHLDVNNIIEIFDPQKQLLNSRYIINSISIPISYSCIMTINATNIEEVAFNG